MTVSTEVSSSIYGTYTVKMYKCMFRPTLSLCYAGRTQPWTNPTYTLCIHANTRACAYSRLTPQRLTTSTRLLIPEADRYAFISSCLVPQRLTASTRLILQRLTGMPLYLAVSYPRDSQHLPVLFPHRLVGLPFNSTP
jgi:hypothetical protein